MIGYAAAALGSLVFLPQAVKTIKTGQTKDISLVMYVIYWFGVILWLLYGIFIQSPPVIIVNAIILLFTSSILVLKIKYK